MNRKYKLISKHFENQIMIWPAEITEDFIGELAFKVSKEEYDIAGLGDEYIVTVEKVSKKDANQKGESS